MSTEAAVPPDLRDSLNRYASMGLIESWEYVEGRGFVVLDGGGHEIVFPTPAQARKAVLLLEGVETALRTGKAKIGSEGDDSD